MFRIIKRLPVYIAILLLIAIGYSAMALDLKAMNGRTLQDKPSFADSITLRSSDVACLGTDPVLIVTGTNVTWYADKEKNTKLAEGNTYHSQPLYRTTNFYLTQTIDGTDSDVSIITIEVVTAILDSYSATRSSCGHHDGSFSFVAHGGSQRYPVQFKLNDGPLQTSGLFENLASGTYTLTVQAAACYGTRQVEIKAQPSPIISLVDIQDPSCGQHDGTLRIAAYGGNGALSYSIDGTVFQEDNVFTELAGGEYVVWAKDDSLCKVSEKVVLKQSIDLVVNDMEVKPTTCGQSNGSIVLPNAPANGNFYYSLNQGTEQTINSFYNLPSGNYQISVSDGGGCKEMSEVVIEDSDGPYIKDVGMQQTGCERADGSITVHGSSSSLLNYSIDAENFQNSSVFSDLRAGNYPVTIKDENGCVARQEIDLTSSCEKKISLPSAFSPNADGINDSWDVFFPLASIDIQEVTIINRWGEVVFYGSPGPIHSGYKIWDGRYKGAYVSGIFTYKLKWRDQIGSTDIMAGQVIVF